MMSSKTGYFGLLLTGVLILIFVSIHELSQPVITPLSDQRQLRRGASENSAINQGFSGYEKLDRNRDDTSRQQSLSEEIWKIARSDMSAAFALVDSRFDKLKARNCKIDILSQLGGEKLERLAEGLALLPAQVRKSAASSVLNTWAEKDPLRLGAYAKLALHEEIQNTALEKAVESLVGSGQFDEAVRIHSDMAKSKERLDAFKAISGMAFKRSRADSLVWISTLQDTDLRRIAEQTFAVKSVNGDSVDETITLANQLASPVAQTILIQGVSKKLASDAGVNPDGWISQLPETLRFPARQAYVTEIAKSSTRQATALASALSDQQQRERILDYIQPLVMKAGIESSVTWISTIPEDSRPRAAYTLASKWASIDQDRARNWINGLPAGKMKERAEAGFQSAVK